MTSELMKHASLDPKPEVTMIEDKGAAENPLRSHYAGLTAKEVRHKFRRWYWLALSTGAAGMYFGYATIAPGSIVANPGFIEVMGTVHNPVTGALELDAVHVSLWSGFTYVGQVVGMLMAPIMGDWWGRKISLYIMTVLMTLSIVLEIVATEWTVFLGGKIIAGVATGLSLAVVMTYIAEISMPQVRGSLIGAYSQGITFGQLPCAIGLEVLQKTVPNEYRRIFYAEFVVVAIWLVPLFVLPESPSWLASKGRDEKGKNALRFLVGHNVPDYDLDHEYRVIAAEMEVSRMAVKHSHWKAIFQGTNLKRTFMATIGITIQMFIGQPLVYGQTTYFFMIAGLKDPFLANLIITLLTLVFVFVGVFIIVERLRVGRRPLQLYGTAGCGILMLIVGILGCFKINEKIAAGLVTACSLWVVVYCFCFGPIGFMLLSEIPTPALRQKSIAFASIFMSCFATMFNYVIPILLSPQKAGLETKIGFVFAGISIPWLAIVYFFLPETANRSFAALDELFERGVAPRKFAKTPTAAEGRESEGSSVGSTPA